jgi:hypothetical protein
LFLNTSTGDLTGTPLTAGTDNFTVRVTDANSSFAQNAFTITVADFPSLSGTLPDGTNGVAYSAKFSAAGGHAPLAYDISAGTLPTGLSINASDGTVSGTPTVNGAFSFTVRLTDSKGNITTRAATVTVYAAVSLSGTLSSPTEDGLVYSDGISTTGGKAPIQWSVLGTLPTGLSINAGTGVISGTVNIGAADQTFSFTVRAVDALGSVFGSPQSIVCKRRIEHDTNAGPARYPIRTFAYTSSVVAKYGNGGYTYAVVGGALPTGLSMNSAGSITGTPTVAGNFSATFRATDNLGATVDRTFTFTVVNPVTLTGTAGHGTVGVAYGFNPTTGGGLAPFEYYSVGNPLPPGLSVNAANGAVTGTPTAAGTYTPTIRVYSQSINDSEDLALTIVINAFPTLSLNYGRGMVGKAYSGTVSTSGGEAPKTYARVAGTLPPGVSLNASTGALSGTPTTVGTYTGTIRMTDGLGVTVDKTYSIGIVAALTIASDYPDGNQGVAYNSSVGASGGYAPYSYSLVSGTIPAGTTRTNATISGTPNTAATYNFTLRVTDADGSTFDKAFSIIIVSSAFSVAASPNPATGYEFSGGFNVTVSTFSTVTPTGGNAPFTYAWTFLSATGSAGVFTASGTNTNRLTVSRTQAAAYLRTETWKCTVTDNIGVVRTVNVQLELEIDDGGGGGSGCPAATCSLPDGRKVADIKAGDLIECVDVVTGERFLRDVRNIKFTMQPCRTLVAKNGGEITQSESTRMILRDGREVTTMEMLGEEVLCYDGRYSVVVELRDAGELLVANVDLGNVMFFAGDGDGVLFATHNRKPE